MAPKAKKEAPAPPKAEAKAKALKAKKAVLKDAHSHKEDRYPRHPPSEGPRHCGSEGSPNTLRRAPPRETSDRYAITKFPLTSESAMKQVEDNIVFIVRVKVNEHPIKQAVKKLYDVDHGHCQHLGQA
ncbi:60S ribosomal protein L23a [Pteropus alecto]|uniref:60S ribosomal protein L23a n=1 Tax=Pteropus alecto TaxID=9402 RepID=L5JYW0_PTEAL|nr:60S ribosomal protein L23a [Pteropus alecto]